MDQTGADDMSNNGTTSLALADRVFADEPMLMRQTIERSDTGSISILDETIKDNSQTSQKS